MTENKKQVISVWYDRADDDVEVFVDKETNTLHLLATVGIILSSIYNEKEDLTLDELLEAVKLLIEEGDNDALQS